MKRLILSLSLCFATVSMFAQISNTEKQALTDFYSATNGDQWVNSWDLTQPVENWDGVTIEDNKVVAIRLLFNNVTGEIPASLGTLKNLKELELSFNKISGELPSELGNLENLEILAFNGNDLTGSIPSNIGSLSNLKQLHLSSNHLTGVVPASLENLKNIEIFNVFDNELFGALPEKLASNINLKEFMVAENNFIDTHNISTTLLLNSGVALDFDSIFTTESKSVIAIETNDDED